MGTFSEAIDDSPAVQVLAANRKRSTLILTNTGDTCYFLWAPTDTTPADPVSPTNYSFYLLDGEPYEAFPDSEHRALWAICDTGDSCTVRGDEN